MTDSQAIAEIVSTLLSHGPVYSGGDQHTAKGIAADWYESGFSAAEVDEWCRVYCWDASVAAEFHAAHMTPRIASRACERYDERHRQMRGMDSMYAACNGDLDTATIIADWVTPDEC